MQRKVVFSHTDYRLTSCALNEKYFPFFVSDTKFSPRSKSSVMGTAEVVIPCRSPAVTGYGGKTTAARLLLQSAFSQSFFGRSKILFGIPCTRCRLFGVRISRISFRWFNLCLAWFRPTSGKVMSLSQLRPDLVWFRPRCPPTSPSVRPKSPVLYKNHLPMVQ